MASKPMSSMDAAGYREVVRAQDQQQMAAETVAFIQRLLHQHQLEVDDETLQRLARQHLKVPSSFEDLLHELRSAPSAPPAQAAQALRDPVLEPDSGGLSEEAVIDGQHLVAQAIDASGTIAVVSPPWSWRHVFGPRRFQLVIRNALDQQRALVVFASWDEQQVRQMAQQLIQELGEATELLGQPERYQQLHRSPATLKRLQTAPLQVAQELQLPTAPPEEDARPDEEHGDCPICLEPIGHGEAAMRCAGDGGQHHYFHARCLSTWVRRSERATCPMCRGHLQMNGQRLQEFLDGEQSSHLSEDDRSYLKSIADGLQGRNRWSNMNRLEKAAYAGGLVAAAGWGFMLGYTERSHRASHALVLHTLPAEHQWAQGVGWIVGIIASCIRQSLRDREREENERRNRGR